MLVTLYQSCIAFDEVNHLNLKVDLAAKINYFRHDVKANFQKIIFVNDQIFHDFLSLVTISSIYLI